MIDDLVMRMDKYWSTLCILVDFSTTQKVEVFFGDTSTISLYDN